MGKDFWEPVVKGGQNLTRLVGIGLTESANYWGGGQGPVTPLPGSGISVI